MKKFTITLLFFMAAGCLLLSCSQPVSRPKPVAVMAPVEVKPEKVLAEVIKILVPVVEKNSKKVQIPVEGIRPSKEYSLEEVEIKKSETGYEIRIWLMKGKEDAQSLSFSKTVSFQIPVVGGHDVEVIGKNQRFLEVIFIDDWQ